MPKGPLTRGEKDTVRVLSSAPDASAAVIAARLKRPIGVIQKELERLAGATPPASPVPEAPGAVRGADPASVADVEVREAPKAADAVAALRASPFWAQIAAAFDKKEQALYEVEWASWSAQLDEGVTHSEWAQVHQAITYLILRNRNLRDQKGLRDRADECERGIRRIEQLHPEPEKRPETQKARLATLSADLRGVFADLKLKAQELDGITTKYSALAESLKSTRNQRLDRIAERTANFMDLIRMLAQDDKREAEGRRAELMRRATLNKAREMGRPHQFADGTWDRPLLSAETVDLGDAPVVREPVSVVTSPPAESPDA